MDYITLKVADVLAVTAADPTRHRAGGRSRALEYSEYPNRLAPSRVSASRPGEYTRARLLLRSLYPVEPCLSGLVALVSTRVPALPECPVCPEAQKATRRRSPRILLRRDYAP